MKPLTNYLHKAMVPFSGIPFLAYSFNSIPEGADVVVIVDYLKEQIINYFGTSYRGRKITYLTQVNPKGTGDALVQFAEAYRPAGPIVVWQADQLLFPEDVFRICASAANAILFSEAHEGLHEIGLWKLAPNTLPLLRNHFEAGEYRALPVIQASAFNQVITSNRKAEISFNKWSEIERICHLYKQRFLIESP